VDRDAALLERLAAELMPSVSKAIVHVADIGDPDEPDRIAQIAKDSFVGLDAVVSNAGFLEASLLLDLTVTAVERVLAVNTLPTWLLGKAAHAMLKESRGSIVATASICADAPLVSLR
jgi:glucose 1-dehydrogenase